MSAIAALAASLALLDAAQTRPLPVERDLAGRVRVLLTTSQPSDGDGRDFVLVSAAGRPVVWTELAAEAAVTGVAMGPASEAGDVPKAWVVRPEIDVELRSSWPQEGPITAKIDGVGVGQGMVWLDLGESGGVRVGDWWRVDSGEQPVARLETIFVGASAAACRVIALTRDLRLESGQAASLWPAAAVDGTQSSAVSYVEPTVTGQRIWIASPPGLGWSSEPWVEFYREGQYVGTGIVQRRDERFWYATALVEACADEVRVGDRARVRVTPGPLEARVFAVAPLVLVAAGESDGLEPGARGQVFRGGSAIGQVEVARVQAGYAVITPHSEGSPLRIERMDVVRFGQHAKRPHVGTVSHVVGLAVGVRLSGAHQAQAGIPYLLRDATGRPVAVAVLLDIAGGAGVGYVIERSIVRPVEAGLIVEAAAARAE